MIATLLFVAFLGLMFVGVPIGAALGLFAIGNMNTLNDADTYLYEKKTVGLSLVKEANIHRYAGVVGQRDALIDQALRQLQ